MTSVQEEKEKMKLEDYEITKKIVQCKDCKYYGIMKTEGDSYSRKEYFACTRCGSRTGLYMEMDYDGFCSEGVKR